MIEQSESDCAIKVFFIFLKIILTLNKRIIRHPSSTFSPTHMLSIFSKNIPYSHPFLKNKIFSRKLV